MIRYLVAKADEIPEGGRKIVEVKGMEFGIFRVKGQFYAWRNICPHAYAPVCVGTICGTRLQSNVYEYIVGREKEIIRCPWHGWEFDLLTGEHLVDPSVKLRKGNLENENLEKGDLETDNGNIYILL